VAELNRDQIELFMAFTYVYWYCRPTETDMFVYSVDMGEVEDQSLTMDVMNMKGDERSLVLSKVWLMENLPEILEKVVV
jgi:hypothetical protein